MIHWISFSLFLVPILGFQCELIKEDMHNRGHMKPFGSHRPPLQVEELKYMISPEDFYMNFVVRHKPVVFKKVTQKWAAYDLWTDEYLGNTYGETKMNMETKEDDKINLPPSRLLKDFLKVYNQSNLYMVDEVIPGMREDVQLPLCLRCEEMDRFFFVSYYWHGGTTSTVHIDTDENLLCVIKGHKKVLLVSPVYSHDLYADDARQMGVLDLNASAVDLNKYPRVMNVEQHEAIVQEGDCVYIPQMWWHQVYSRKERQQAVAMWWKSKPFWKSVEQGQTSSPQPEEKRNQKHSYATALIDYEHWVQNVSQTLPLIRCKEQDRKMSSYQWETDKDSSAPTTLGDGGTIEEEVFKQHYQYMSTPQDVKQAVNDHVKKSPAGKFDAVDVYGGLGYSVMCDFDKNNPKSPCYFKFEENDGTEDEREEESNFQFIRYVMDYCQEFEDRGCVINKPQLLNKMLKDEFKQMAFTEESVYNNNKQDSGVETPSAKNEL